MKAAGKRYEQPCAIASDLLYWKGGLKVLRHAQLSKWRGPRHVELERGKFNRAIKNFVLAGLQPDDVPAVQAAFVRLWPRATCTALGLANHLPRLFGTAEGMGWYVQATEATP